MGVSQSNIHTIHAENENEKKRMYNNALSIALMRKLKYIEEHDPCYHGNFEDYYSKINNLLYKDISEIYDDNIRSSKKSDIEI